MQSNIAEQRKQKGYSQSQVAEKIGVTRQMISAIENGASPSIKTAQKLAEIFGCTIDDLLRPPANRTSIT
jgi:transcriptional regulator with XRE-family HTH domain